MDQTLADGRKPKDYDSDQVVEMFKEALALRAKVNKDIRIIEDEILSRMGE